MAIHGDVMAEVWAALLGGLVVGGILGLVLGRLIYAARERGGRLAAEARLDEVQASLMGALRERDQALGKYDEARDTLAAAETRYRLSQQEIETMRRQVGDWEATKAKFLEATQAGVLATAQQLSTKLIEDHKRETAAAKEAAEKQVKETADAMRQEVRILQGGVDALKGQVAEKGQLVDTVWRALTTPAGAGYFAEIGLANTLKSFGLVEGRDFVLQETLYGEEAGRRLRPDAIVFLPGDAVLVIDAKASKHLIELAQAEGTEGEDLIRASLARRMNQHLKDLTDRDYRGAVQNGWRKSGRSGDLSRVLSVMYLPNESALEKLGQADADFPRKAADAQIIPAGPAGLACIIGFASVEIRMMRQIENQEQIVKGAERLLESVAVVIGHAATVGRGIRQAADGFAKLTTSVNGRLLPRARQLQQMGLRAPKPVPGNLGAYQVLDLGAEAMIEGEAEEVGEGAASALPGWDKA
jgi:DNA recombination protein RmuC